MVSGQTVEDSVKVTAFLLVQQCNPQNHALPKKVPYEVIAVENHELIDRQSSHYLEFELLKTSE